MAATLATETARAEARSVAAATPNEAVVRTEVGSGRLLAQTRQQIWKQILTPSLFV